MPMRYAEQLLAASGGMARAAKEQAATTSGLWGFLTSFREARNVEVAVGGHYCPGGCVRRGVRGRTPARRGTIPCSRAAEPRSGSHLAAVQDRHKGREERSVEGGNT